MKMRTKFRMFSGKKHGAMLLATCVFVIVLFIFIAERHARARAAAEFVCQSEAVKVQEELRQCAASADSQGLRDATDTHVANPPPPSGENNRIIETVAQYRRLFEEKNSEIKSLVADIPDLPSDPHSWNDDDLRHSAEILLKAEETLSTVERLVQEPGPTHISEYSKAGWQEMYDQQRFLGYCGRLFLLRAALRQHEGNASGAEADLIALARLAGKIRIEPALEPLMTSDVLYGNLSGQICCLFPPPVTLSLANAVTAELENVDVESAFVDAISGSSRYFKVALELSKTRSLSPIATSGIGERVSLFVHRTPFAPLWAAACEDRYFADAAALKRLAALPYWQAVGQYDAVATSGLGLTAWDPYVTSQKSCIWRYALSNARAQARRDLLFLGLRIEAYRKTNGRFPLSLREIDVSRSSEPLRDRFNGKPYVYSSNDSGFLLYSVGPDLKDDAGNPWKDIVWRPPAENSPGKAS